MNNIDEINNLITENMPLVYYLVSKYYPTYTTDDDLKQVGMIGLCNAAKKFDSEKSKFSTYASRCIIHEIGAEFKRRSKHWGDVSLESECSDSEECTIGDTLVGEEGVGFFDEESLYSKLTEREKNVYNLLRQGFTVPEIVSTLKYSRGGVYKNIKNIKRKWKECYGD